MKILTRFLAVIGALAILYVLIGMGVNFNPPNQLDRMRETFGKPEAIMAISELYKKIETNPHDPLLKVEIVHSSGNAKKVRSIPSAWIIDCFSRQWFSKNTLQRGEAVAYYDDNDSLIGIEFYQSRHGCFVSRDDTRCPPMWFTSLHRITESPLYITLRLSTPD